MNIVNKLKTACKVTYIALNTLGTIGVALMVLAAGTAFACLTIGTVPFSLEIGPRGVSLATRRA